MPKHKTVYQPEEANIIEQPITNALEINFMPYAMSVILSRAIPEIDGFKPAHRKLLYTMYKMGLMTGGRVKSADVVGQTMRLNPHGDAAIYETLVRLTRGNGALLHPFVDSKGNFGKQYSRDMAYAQSRYTEVKLDAICRELFRDIDKRVVDFAENYNNTTTEPTLLPATFPNLLVTPNLGIAVGMASSVCSFNLKEVCAAAAALLKNPRANLLKLMPGPDFATGGELLYSEKDTEQVYATGRGVFKLRARWRFDKKQSCIEIYEIPYTTTAEAIIDKIIALVKANKLRDVNDVRDETDLNGLKIAVDIKKSAAPDAVMRRLFSLTPLCDSFNCNFNFLIDGRPRTMGVAEIINEWVKFRIGCIKRGLAYDIEKKSAQLHLLEGLAKILLDIDKAIRIIRGTEAEAMVIPNLMKGFNITEAQAEYIAEIKLRNLNREHLLNRVNERDALKAELNQLNDMLKSDELIRRRITDELREVSKKYGAPRRTEIVYEQDAPAPPEEEFIDDYNVKLFLTEHNFFKKISLVSLRASSEQYLKDDDSVMQELDVSNKSEVLFFSNRSAVYKARVYDLPDGKASALGEYMQNLLGLDDGERVVYMAAANDYRGYMLFAFENGKAAKVIFSGYATKTNRKKLINAYSDKSPLISAQWLPEDCDFYLTRGDGKAMIVNTSLITANASKASSGVQVFALRKNTRLARMLPLAAAVSGGLLDGDDDLEYYRADKIPSAGHFKI